MSGKQLYNQRNIFKITSKTLREADWDLNISKEDVKKGYYSEDKIVSLGDSQLLRFIRQIRNINYSEEEIRQVKKEIKETKKINKNNLKRINELYKKLDEMIFLEDYVAIVFENKKDFNRATNKEGFKINGAKFKRLIGTTGGVKQNTVMFCNEEIWEELNNKLENDRDKKVKVVPAKFEAYKSLSASASTPVTQPKGILVIKDISTIIKDKVIKVSDNGQGGFKVDYNVDYEAEKEFCDGCAMISPELAEQWAIDLGFYYIDESNNKKATYIPSGFNTRWSYNKGMVFTFPYKEFAEEVAHEYLVEDCWGNMQDIREIDLILTTNMLKLWNAYSSIEDYVSKCKKNGYDLCVSKVCVDKLEEKRNMNYQYLQSYEMSDEDIYELCSPQINMINDSIGNDWAKMVLYTNGENMTKRNITNIDYCIDKALLVDKRVCKDGFIRSKVGNMIKKKINDSKKGVIQVDGNYSIVSGDLYAMCQGMFKMEVTGILKAHEFYSKTWIDKGVYEIVAYRSPMTSHNNITKMKLIKNEQTEKWFRYMKCCTILNAWDTTTDRMNGMDFDSDAIITTNNPIILRNTKEDLTIICEQTSTPKEIITEAKLKRANKNGFGNDVGTITNRVTAMFDVLASLEKNSEEYKELMDRIICGQAYQQESIDKIKGIQAKEMPKTWYTYKANKIKVDKETGEIIDSEEEIKRKTFDSKIMVNKKPYFFIYNYPELANSYNEFLKRVNDNCIINFCKTLDELENFGCETEEEQKFLNSVNYKRTVFKNNSVMNKICKVFEEEFKNFRLKVKDDNFDYTIYKKIKKVKHDEIFNSVENVFKQYKKDLKDNRNTVCTDGYSLFESDDNMIDYTLLDYYREEFYSVCPDKFRLCDIILDLTYGKGTNKTLAWDICGEQIISNLLDKNDNKYTILVKDENGSIEWNGNKFREEKVEVE